MEYIFDRITIDDKLCNGKPTIRGKRITKKPLENFSNGFKFIIVKANSHQQFTFACTRYSFAFPFLHKLQILIFL